MENKAYIIRKLIRTGRMAARAKLIIGTGGNISARSGDSIYLKTSGISLASANVKDYALIDLKTGKNSHGLPSSEKYVHMACYKTRSDINTVLHFHPVFSTAVANSQVKLGPVSYELLGCLKSELVRAAYKPAHSKALAKEIARLIKKSNAVLMPNHGLLVVGENLDEAYNRTLAVERACQTLIFSRLLGLPKFLPKKETKRIIALCEN